MVATAVGGTATPILTHVDHVGDDQEKTTDGGHPWLNPSPDTVRDSSEDQAVIFLTAPLILGRGAGCGDTMVMRAAGVIAKNSLLGRGCYFPVPNFPVPNLSVPMMSAPTAVIRKEKGCG